MRRASIELRRAGFRSLRAEVHCVDPREFGTEKEVRLSRHDSQASLLSAFTADLTASGG